MVIFFLILVPESPSIEAITPSKAVREGDDLVLRCNAKGYPDPKVTWFRAGLPLPVCVKNSNSKCTSGQHYIWRADRQDLKIRRVQYSSDDGVFKCEAVNNFGRATADVNLTVLSKWNHWHNINFRKDPSPHPFIPMKIEPITNLFGPNTPICPLNRNRFIEWQRVRFLVPFHVLTFRKCPCHVQFSLNPIGLLGFSSAWGGGGGGWSARGL